MSALFMATGTCRLGQTTRDGDGNIIKQTPPSFEPDQNGGSVIVGRIKFTDDGMEQDGPADVFGDWDAAGYLRQALEIIKPSRRHNIPNFEGIIKTMAIKRHDNECPFLEHCESVFCQDCIVSQWIEDTEETK